MFNNNFCMKIFVKNIDESTLKQFQECLEQKFVVDGALMPDAHYGYVAPIGSVLITKGVIVPSWVGYDIGCGVTAIKINGKNLLPKVNNNSQKIFLEIKKEIPMGLGKLRAEHRLSIEGKKEFEKIFSKLDKKLKDKELVDWVKRKAKSNLGTVGHGNHFIELDTSGKDLWLIIHSGSRNVGHHIAEHYMRKAMELNGEKGNVERTFGFDVRSTIGKEYLVILEFCLEFALLNRLEIARDFINIFEKTINKKVEWVVWANKNHNNAERIGKTNNFIHRKGATPSKKGEKGVIPGNMRDGTFLVIGKGNKNFLESSSHGAGRAMSKRTVKEKITLKEFENTMKGITAVIEKGTIDESPFAYKNIFDVMNSQKESVKIHKHLKPIINWKGIENR